MKITKSQLKDIIREEIQAVQEYERKDWKLKGAAGGALALGAGATATGVGALAGGPLMAAGGFMLALDQAWDLAAKHVWQRIQSGITSEEDLVEITQTIHDETKKKLEAEGKEVSDEEMLKALEMKVSLKLKEMGPDRGQWKFRESKIMNSDAEESVKNAIWRALERNNMTLPDMSDRDVKMATRTEDFITSLDPQAWGAKFAKMFANENKNPGPGRRLEQMIREELQHVLKG